VTMGCGEAACPVHWVGSEVPPAARCERIPVTRACL
jgi:hypothetical protein